MIKKANKKEKKMKKCLRKWFKKINNFIRIENQNHH